MSSAKQTAKTLVIGVVLMVIAGFAPAVVMAIVGWPNAVNVAILAGLAAFTSCMAGSGWRTGVVMALPFAALAGLVTWAAPNPWWAAVVMAIAAFLRGYAAKAGMHDALIMAVISLGFLVASPVESDTSLPAPMLVVLVSLGATLWATLIIFLLRTRLHQRQHERLNPIRVMAFSVALAFMIGVATWFVVDLGLGHSGAWIILTIVVVFQPSLGAGFRKAFQRAAGTVLGFFIAIIIGAFLPTGLLLPVVGSGFLMVALLFLLQARPYWIFATFLTPAVVLLESGGSSVDTVAVDRLGATVIGVSGTLIVMLALAPLAKHLEDKAASQAG